MKIIINESQLRLIVENEEYINSIKELINTFDENNINMAFQIMIGLKIKQSVMLDEYTELFEIFKLKPSKLNLIKIGNRKEVYVKNRSSVPDILFKMSNLEEIIIIDVNNLGNLTSFNGDLEIKTKGVIPNLTYVGGNLIVYGGIKSLPNLKSVGGYLYIVDSEIKSLPKLESVGNHLDLGSTQIDSLPKLESVGEDLYLEKTPLGKKLSETMTKDEIRNKYGVKGDILLWK